ncbi:F-box/kelch-repeat protein At3g23880-like [Silene latifolia]|uniref:F-box/kelch-repeat protein At3g23880-like n=1 Tax=Silene latifolia TaxID=37657 RepID=UPI003D78AE23
MAGYLHESLIHEILSWLPVKSLLRFKSVSKSWYAIITSRCFIRKHVRHKHEPHGDHSIAQYFKMQAKKLKSDVSWVINTHDSDCDIHVLGNVFPCVNYICGPCDGIYFMCKCKDGKQYYLWNPCLNEEKKLPPIIRKPNIFDKKYNIGIDIGFGFDPVTEDYKAVVIIKYRNNDRPPSSIMVYSLRKDSWSYAGDLSKSYYLQEAKCYAFVNTSYYWLGKHVYMSHAILSHAYDVIIVVDLVTEGSREIGLPEMRMKGPMTWDSYSECLMVYHGSIALVALYVKENNFDIWTLSETTSSWSKELTVKLDFSIRIPHGQYCVNNNMVLFQAVGRGIILFDPDSNEFCVIICINTKAPWPDTNNTVFVCMKSLIPINDRKFWE